MEKLNGLIFFMGVLLIVYLLLNRVNKQKLMTKNLHGDRVLLAETEKNLSDSMTPIPLNQDDKLGAAKILNYYMPDVRLIKPTVSTTDFPDSIPIVKVREDIYTKQPVERFKIHELQKGRKYSLSEFFQVLQCPASQPDLGYSGSLEMLKMIPPTKETVEVVCAWTEHGGDWGGAKEDILKAREKYKNGEYPEKYDPKCPRCGHSLYRVINSTLYYDWPWGVNRTVPARNNQLRQYLPPLAFVLGWLNDLPDSVFFMGGQDPHFPWNFPFPDFTCAPSMETNHIAWPWPEAFDSEQIAYEKIKANRNGSFTDENYLQVNGHVKWEEKVPKLAFHATFSPHRQIAFELGNLRPDLFAFGSSCPGSTINDWHPLSYAHLRASEVLNEVVGPEGHQHKHRPHAHPGHKNITRDQILELYGQQLPGYATNMVSYCGKKSHGSEYQFKYILVPISCGAYSTSGRFARLLAQSGSVILLQTSPFVYHFSARLKPWVHYVPVSYALSDLTEKVIWLREHDDLARQIAANAKAFADSYLRYEDYHCYVASALYTVGRLLNGSTAVTEPFDPVRADLSTVKPYGMRIS